MLEILDFFTNVLNNCYEYNISVGLTFCVLYIELYLILIRYDAVIHCDAPYNSDTFQSTINPS